MSHNYYRNSPDDYRSHQDLYSDSYQSDSDLYRHRARSASQESKHSGPSSSRTTDPCVLAPGKSLSFLRRREPATRDFCRHEDLPDHLSLERVESWQDRWGNPRKTGSVTSVGCRNSSKMSDTLDYNYSSDGDPRRDERHYSSAASEAFSSVSHSYGDREPRRDSEPLHSFFSDTLLKVPTRKEASDFHGVLPPVFPYACVLCDITVLNEKVWTWHIRGARHGDGQLELLKKYPEWDQNIDTTRRNEFQAPLQSPSNKKRDPYHDVPTRKEASDFQGRVPPVFPDECVLCRWGVFSKEEWSEHIEGALHAKGQLELVERYPSWDQKIESSRRNEWHRTAQPKTFVKRDPFHKVPTRKEASDYHGKIPPIFPYACVLCDITVLSEHDWLVHTRGTQHADSQFILLERYPEWDKRIQSARRNEIQVMPKFRSTKKTGGHQEEIRQKSFENEDKKQEHRKMVCITFAESSVEEGDLKDMLGPFGVIVKVTMFPTLALVEMESKEQAKEIVKHFTDNPLEIQEKRVEFSISTKSALQSSRVVSFTPLPAGEGTTSELMAIAKRFGTVKNSLFLPSRGYVEMIDLVDAKKLVEHYSAKPLKLKKKTIQVTFSSEFDTLTVRVSQVDHKVQSPRSSRRSSSPGRHSSERDSPSPKRRRMSSERSNSSRSSSSKEREDWHDSQEKQNSSDKDDDSDKMSVGNDYDALVDSDSDLEGLAVIADDEEELQDDDDDEDDGDGDDVDVDYGDDDDDDVDDGDVDDGDDVGGDGDEDDEDGDEDDEDVDGDGDGDDDDGGDDETVDPMRDQEQKTCEEVSQLSGQPSSSSATTTDHNKTSAEEEQNHLSRKIQANSLSSRVDIPIVPLREQVKTFEDTSETGSSKTRSLREEQKLKEEVDEDLEMEFPGCLENCITLDELDEESGSDHEESKERNTSNQNTESTVDDITKSTSPLVHASYMDSEENKAPSESANERAIESVVNSEEGALRITTDQCRENQDIGKNGIEESFGRVLDVRNLPKAEAFTDLDFMHIAMRYGEVKHYLLTHSRKRGLIEMVNSTDAEQIAADAKNQDIALRGSILKIKVSEKYNSLPTAGFNFGSESDDEKSSKRANYKKIPEATVKPSKACQKPNEPVGTEFVNSVMGYICNLCNVIYVSEAEAKDEHCRSPLHHEKLKEHKKKMP